MVELIGFPQPILHDVIKGWAKWRGHLRFFCCLCWMAPLAPGTFCRTKRSFAVAVPPGAILNR